MNLAILTIMALLSVVYCCDIPAIKGFEFLVNRKDSLVYGVGLSIIASYIFFFIQTWIPKKIKEKQAYTVLEKNIMDFIELLDELLAYIEQICKVDKEKGRIIVGAQYICVDNVIWEQLWLEKIEIKKYIKWITKNRDKIKASGYFFLLSDKYVKCLQKLFDTPFFTGLEINMELDAMGSSPELIKNLEVLRSEVDKAKKIFGIKSNFTLTEVQNNEWIDDWETKLKGCSTDVTNRGIIRVNLGKKSEKS